MTPEVTYGYCHCGCGEKTTIPQETSRKNGRIKGIPMRYVHGHHGRKMDHEKQTIIGEKISIHSKGYLRVRAGTKYQHRLIAEKALGKPLPEKVQIHHVDLSVDNNSNRNLVICEDQAYHRLLHNRTEAYLAGRPPRQFFCNICKTWKEPEDFYYRKLTAKSRPGERITTCKKCSYIKSQAHHKKYPEKKRQRDREYGKRRRERKQNS